MYTTQQGLETRAKSVSRGAKRRKTPKFLPKVTDKAVQRFLEALSCPRSLAVWMLYKYSEHQQLVDLTWEPTWYRDEYDARDAYVATEFLSKADFLCLDVDRERVALDRMAECELLNAETNARFKDLSKDPLFKGPNVSLLQEVKDEVSRSLGELPEHRDDHRSSFSIEELFDSCAWGPGSTTLVKGSKTGSAHKFHYESGITKDCFTLVGAAFRVAYPLWDAHLMRQVPGWGLLNPANPDQPLPTWFEGKFSFEPGNVILTVPKNAKTDRVISAEPGLNLWFQLGVGKMIRRWLLRTQGFDLRDQSRNGLLAFYGSLSQKVATVDLRDASNSLATEVCRAVLPHRWFTVMDSLRSKCGILGGIWRKYELFSSMGNGFTFPLQSLLFGAIAICVSRRAGLSSDYVGVFGDDIIIPVEAYPQFLEACKFFGLRVNTRKTFAEGFFRESCGTHYLRGVDLKPLYLKERLSDVHRVFRFANGVRRLARRFGGRFCHRCDDRFRRTWVYLQGVVPEKIRFSVPEGYGDGGFVENFDEVTPSTRLKAAEDGWKSTRGIEGYVCTSFVSSAAVYKSQRVGLHLARLYALGQEGEPEHISWDDLPKAVDKGNAVTLRRVVKTRVTRVLYHEWSDLGPWGLTPRSFLLR